jgi:putative tryptophan/tyrosine transport system substrate-binding protein
VESAFAQPLGELGWVEDRSVIIVHRAAGGLVERAGEIASEFVRLKVNVILTSGDAQGLAVKPATKVIPIVIAIMGDPVGSGLVATLSRPGGNVTGLSLVQADTAGKRLELGVVFQKSHDRSWTGGHLVAFRPPEEPRDKIRT